MEWIRFFDNRINYDILTTIRKRILNANGRKVKKMEESFPKAVKVENIANILKVTFENGEVKYVKSHWTEEITDALQYKKKGRGKRKNLLALSTNMWIGTEVTIEADGTVFINGKDKYTPQELWLKGENHIPEL